jgi:hypothetical protein
MPTTGTAIRTARAGPPVPSRGLRCRVRLADGRTFTGELPAARHRALQLGMLHADSDGLVELAAGRRRNGRLAIATRERADHFLPGGATGHRDWLTRLLALAEQHAARDEEVFVAPAVRSHARGNKDAVAHTRALWIDVDRPGQLPALWALLAGKPCHLLIESAGSGGAHAYWKLDRPLPAGPIAGEAAASSEPIERAHLRLIHHLGVDRQGKPDVADPAVKDRSRVMRLAGTVNGKTRQHARILEADFRLAPYDIDELVGDLPDPTPPTARRGKPAPPTLHQRDAYKRISPQEYAEQLGGLTSDAHGFISCPSPDHPDRHPSAHLGRDAGEGWHCFSCGAGGAIYDFASVLLGGPYGAELCGEAFKRARAYVADVFGELT